MQTKLSHVEMFRGVAALAVTWFHLTGQWTGWVGASGALGWLGVDSFFVLSGFVIPYSLWESGYGIHRFPRFVARRIVRLEPPYLASIALVLVLAYISPLVPGFRGTPVHYTVPQVAAHLFYLVPAFRMDWINPVYWSLTYEFCFYLAAGLLFPWLQRQPLVWTALFTVAAAAAVPVKQSFIEPRVMLFLIGIAAMRKFTGRDGLAVFLTCVLGAGALICATGQVASGIVGVATGLILALVKLPRIRLLTGLGAISYSLYLTHVPIGGRIVNLGKRFAHGAPAELAVSLAALAVSLAFAWVFYRLLEAPSTALARRLSLRDRKAASSEPSPVGP